MMLCGQNESYFIGRRWGSDMWNDSLNSFMEHVVKGVSSALGQFGSGSMTPLASYKTSGKLNNPLLQSSLVW